MDDKKTIVIESENCSDTGPETKRCTDKFQWVLPGFIVEIFPYYML